MHEPLASRNSLPRMTMSTLTSQRPGISGAGTNRLAWARVLLLAVLGLFVNGAALAQPEIRVTSNGSSIISGLATPIDFGSLRPGRSIVRTFTISNLGTQALVLGTDPADASTRVSVTAPFQVGLQPAASIRPGGRGVFRITFPESVDVGVFTATVSIATNDSNENPFTFIITGEQVPQEPVLELALGLQSLSDGDEIGFGTLASGARSARTVTIINSGVVPLRVERPSVSGTGFSTPNTRAITIGPGRRTSISLRFLSTAAGAATGALTLASNDPDRSTAELALAANVSASSARVEVFDGSSPVADNQTIQFGSVANGRILRRTFTIRNGGRAPLTLGALTLDAGAAGVTITSQPARSLASSRSTRFSVQMVQPATGDPAGTLRFTTSDSTNPEFAINLAGFVGSDQAEVAVSGPDGPLSSGSTLDFGVVRQNFDDNSATGELTAQIVILNQSVTTSLALGNVAVTGAGFTLTTAPASLIAPGRSATGLITFQRSAVGVYTGALTFQSNDPDESLVSINLRAEVEPTPLEPEITVSVVPPGGTPQNLSLANATVNFPAVVEGGTSDVTIRISNTGFANLTLSTPISTTSPSFTIFTQPAASVARNASTNMVVRLSSASAGSKSGTLTITNNDTASVDGLVESTFVINLRGEVIAAQANIALTQRVGSDNVPVPKASTVSFGAIQRDDTPITRFFDIRNPPPVNGNGSALNITGPVTLNPDPSSFSILQQPNPTTVPVSSTQTSAMAISLTPTAPASPVVTVSIPNNDTNDNPFTYSVSARIFGMFPSTTVGAGIGRSSGTAQVRALLEFDRDGSGGADPNYMYAAGDFDRILPGTSVRNIVRRSLVASSPWVALPGGGTDGPISAIATWNHDNNSATPPLLIVGGLFAEVDPDGTPVEASNLALWNGATWAPLLTSTGFEGASAEVRALAVWDDDNDGQSSLFIGGAFTTAAGVTVNRIAEVEYSISTGFYTYRVLGTSPNIGVTGTGSFQVRALAVYDQDGPGTAPNQLYVGGTFSSAGNLMNTARLARWTNSAWGSVGVVSGAAVNAMTIFDTDGTGGEVPSLIIAGDFDVIGGVSGTDSIARFSGGAFRSLQTGATNGVVNAVTTFDEGAGLPRSLFAAGSFTQICGTTASSRVARFNANIGSGQSWIGVGKNVSNADVLSMPFFAADGAQSSITALYLGGSFTSINGVSTDRVGVWGVATP